MVVDTSAIMAVFFREPCAEWAADRLGEYAGELHMSTVSLAETLILLKDRVPQKAHLLEQRLHTSGIEFVAPDEHQAKLAAEARLKYPLNLGDCFVYALAKTLNTGILTLDADFRKVDVPVLLPPDGAARVGDGRPIKRAGKRKSDKR